MPVSALAPHRDLLAAEFLERPPHTTAEACERIEQLTGVRRGESRVREFMRDELDTTHRLKIDSLMTLHFQTFGNVSMPGK